MNKFIALLGATALTATAANAGGIDRSVLSFGTLFEKGNYVEFGTSHVMPKVQGTYAARLGGTATGNMAGNYTTLSFSYKRDISDKLAYGVFVNMPYGANSNYTAGPYSGLSAEWESKQLAVLLKYKVQDNVSVYGGLKLVNSKATINIPDTLIRTGLATSGKPAGVAIATGSPAGSLAYSASGPSDSKMAYIVGAAYEKPEIALRVGLTYESGFTHKFKTTEAMASPFVASLMGTSTTSIKMPQSLTLDFQSGVAADTLVFGSLRWSEWSVWEVKPAGYAKLTGTNVTNFSNDVLTWNLGVGRKLNDNFSIFARIGYEKANGGLSTRLAPTDGSKSIGIGGTYTKDNMKITAGLQYAKLGDATDASGTKFTGGKAVGFGMSVGYRF